MANGLGRFANISQAQRAAVQPVASPLESLIQGFQTGQAIQNLPQTLQEQRQLQALQLLERQLAAQRGQAQLEELLNPNLALTRQIQRELAVSSALRPELGIIAAPAGLETETIGAATVATPTQLAQIQAGVAPTPTLQRPAIRPIMAGGTPTGFAVDVAIPEEARRIAEAARIREIQARGEEAENIARIRSQQIAEAIASRERIASTRRAPGGLTEKQKLKELSDASKFGIDVDQFRDSATGEINWEEVATARGRAEGEQVSVANAIKNARLDASARRGEKPNVSEATFQLYGNRMSQADNVLLDLERKGFDPTSVGAEGLVGSWLPNLLKPAERQQFEQAQRNFINAVLRRESGAAIKDSEFINAERQYFPQPGDSEDTLIQKKEARKLVIDEFKRLGGQALPETSSPPLAPVSINAAPLIRTKEEFDALPSGSRYQEEDGKFYIKP